jgi:hypothetical protein
VFFDGYLVGSGSLTLMLPSENNFGCCGLSPGWTEYTLSGIDAHRGGEVVW